MKKQITFCVNEEDATFIPSIRVYNVKVDLIVVLRKIAELLKVKI